MWQYKFLMIHARWCNIKEIILFLSQIVDHMLNINDSGNCSVFLSFCCITNAQVSLNVRIDAALTFHFNTATNLYLWIQIIINIVEVINIYLARSFYHFITLNLFFVLICCVLKLTFTFFGLQLPCFTYLIVI